MRLVSFEKAGRPGYGRLEGDQIHVFGWGGSLRQVLALDEAALAALPVVDSLPLSGVSLLPPVPDAGKILCVATNFHEPSRDGQPVPDYPLTFTRFADTVVGQGEDLLCPPQTGAYDYEGELAVVIGKPAHRVSRETAMAHVAGYACFNDGSVRNWQKHSTQFTPGKNFWRSGSFGPWLVTPSEVPDPAGLTLTTRVNGQQKQHISLSQMIFDIPWLISYMSTFAPLSPGDVIVTGTPSGFGATRRPQEFLAIGDEVEVEIPGVGLLRNRVAQG